MTQREFCDTEGITVGALGSWLHKRSWKPVDCPRFVEVTTPRRYTATEVIERRVGDVHIVVPWSIPNAQLVELVALKHRKEPPR